jgi:hypothetical protein
MPLASTGLVKLKMRMLRPMPTASDSSAMAVNPGVARSRFRANPTRCVIDVSGSSFNAYTPGGACALQPSVQ